MSAPNPLLTIELPIPWGDVRAEHVKPAVDRLLESAEKRVDAIGAAPRTFEPVLGELDAADRELEYVATLAQHLESVLGTPELREAYSDVLPRVSEYASKVQMKAPVYQALRELAATAEGKSYAGARRRFLDKTLANFRRNGAELDAAGKTRLSEIDVALSELTLEFAQNVVDATAAIDVVIEDASRLGGLPDGALEAAKKSAEEKGKQGWRFTLQAPSAGPVLSFADDRALRERIFRAHTTRAADKNPEIIRKVLALRTEKAKLLGFAHYADFATEDRMAKSGAGALGLVTMLAERLRPGFARENAELTAFANANGHAGALEPWDVTYYAEKQRRAKFDFDEETLRPYFPLDRVTRGLFEVASSLYGITIERDVDARVWHSDVTAWSVKDAAGKRLGGFYFDLFPRETKRDGAWMGGVVDRLPGTSLERENIAIVVANVTPPRSAGQPAFLNHREVETLFHEFGHMMHHVLSEVPIRALAGTRVVSDFVELPSMIMENWCWEREALDRFARHWETGAPIPDAVKDRMLAARTYRAANALMRQLGFSTVDLLLHTEYDPAIHGEVMAFARDTVQRFSAATVPPDYAMLASFLHLFSSATGYAAGYYSYQWAQVLEADAFGRFREAGILNPEVGARFRTMILSRGDTEDPAVLYREFLGRDPDVGALLTRLGVA